MNSGPESLVAVHEYSDSGYQPMVDFNGWRVAVLNYHHELLPQEMEKFHRHDETEEVFMLVSGRCLLYLGEGKDTITDIHAIPLEVGKLYNVKQGVWHSHTLTQDARVMIVENTDTGEHNSPQCILTAENLNRVSQLATEYGLI